MTQIARLSVAIRDQTQSGAQSAARNISEIRRSAQGMDTSVRRAEQGLGTLRSALVSISAALTVRQLTTYADAWTNAENRIRLFTRSAEETARVQGSLFNAAQDTRSAFGETVELYQRLAQNANELGVSQERIIGLTKTINQSLVISGTSSASAAAALVQLGQAFASGQLRGQELNSVLEQAPRLAKAIADGLGTTVGQLRSLGEQGKLTAQDLIRAIEGQASTLAGEFTQIKRTFGQSLTELNNEFTKFVGELDDSLDLTENLTGIIKSLSQNIDTLTIGVRALAGALLVLTGSRILTGLKTLAATLTGHPLLALGTLGTSALFAFSDKIKPLGDDVTTLNDIFKAFVATLIDSDKKFSDLLKTAREFANLRTTPTGTTGPVQGPTTTIEAATPFRLKEQLPIIRKSLEAAVEPLTDLNDGLGRLAPALFSVFKELTSFEKLVKTLADGSKKTEFKFVGDAATAATVAFGLLATAILSINNPVRTFADEMQIASQATVAHTRALEDYVSIISQATRTQVAQVGESAALFEQTFGSLLRSSVITPSVKDELIDFFRFGPAREGSVNVAGQKSEAAVTLEDLGLSEKQFRQIAQDLFVGIDPKLATQSIIDDLLARSDEARFAAQNFGDIDARTVAGAVELFRRESRIQQPQTQIETQALLRAAFAQFREEQGVDSVFDFGSGLVNPLIDVTNRELLTLEELLAETRNFSTASVDFYQQTLTANRANSLFFDKEEAALRARLSTGFTGDARLDRAASQRFDREITALFQLRLAYERTGALPPGASVGTGGVAKAVAEGGGGGSLSGSSGSGVTPILPTQDELETALDLPLSDAVASVLSDELATLRANRLALVPDDLVIGPDRFQFQAFFADDGRIRTPLEDGLNSVLVGLGQRLDLTPGVLLPGQVFKAPTFTEYFFHAADSERFADPLKTALDRVFPTLVPGLKTDVGILKPKQVFKGPSFTEYFFWASDSERFADPLKTALDRVFPTLVPNLGTDVGILKPKQVFRAPTFEDYLAFANEPGVFRQQIEGGLSEAFRGLGPSLSLAKISLRPDALVTLSDVGKVEAFRHDLFTLNVQEQEFRPIHLAILNNSGDSRIRLQRPDLFDMQVGRRDFQPDQLGGLDRNGALTPLRSADLYSYSVGRRLFSADQLAGLNTYLGRVNLGRDQLYNYSVGRRLFSAHDLAGLNTYLGRVNLGRDQLFNVQLLALEVPASSIVQVTGAIQIPQSAFRLPQKIAVDINDLVEASGVADIGTVFVDQAGVLQIRWS